MVHFKKVLIIITEIFIIATALFLALVVFLIKPDKESYVFDLSQQVFISDVVPNVVWLVIFLVILLAFLFLLKRRSEIEDVLPKRFLIIASVLLLALQMIVVYTTYFVVGNDAGIVAKGAQYFVDGTFDEFYNLRYFQYAPNNLYIYAFYIIVFKISNIFNLNASLLLAVISAVFANISVLLSALCVWEITKRRSYVYFSYIVGALLFALQAWIVVPYTDSLSIVFPILTLYIYLKLRDWKGNVIIKWLIISIVPMISYSLKALNIIIIIAILISAFLHKKEGLKKVLMSLAGVMVAFLIGFLLHFCIEKAVGVTPDDNKKLDISWYLLLGSNYETYGQFNFGDYNLIFSDDELEVRSSEALECVKERIADMGILGIARHWINESHVFFNDPTFGWGVADYTFEDIPEREDELSQVIRDIYYPAAGYGFVMNNQVDGYGNNYWIYIVFRQIIWIPIISLMLFYFIFKRNKEEVAGILSLTFVGIFLFSMLFETSSRLLISYLPIFAVIAILGLSEMVDLLRKKVVEKVTRKKPVK